ncbi:predicted protein [Scheffersomyces stipitis CBS 6054]|uniref:Uncharacterized protein n=1 Tax=Scheffersomyces stipitis (strain ATCC 58785 / CBS 6054 / NBRC 10063 / NRRL Y-11545) TaxID=322104 RepID=A3LV55_PICST|nr:predicted protein [Scheffersomyces stipitis CBS 6054]ABN66718.1 predicted protein [Scheffersomyces stipitis CBS 6054]KAG2731296.1 hypothetical protein G9P44_005712 [Scheffersomyces stipitis]
MKFVLYMLYFLKINLLQIIVHGQRSHSITLQHIDSSIFEATRCTPETEEFADRAFVVNITDIPVI